MKKFSISLQSLKPLFVGIGIGVVIGALAVGLFVHYLISAALSNTPTKGQFLGSSIDQVRNGIETSKAEQDSTNVYGKVLSIGGGALVIEATRTAGNKESFTFVYDDSTRFVQLKHDAASTELPLSSDTITSGTYLYVSANQPIGSVTQQHATKIVEY